MKKNTLNYLLFLFMFIMMSSCKKADQGNDQGNKWSFSFDLDGVNYKDEGFENDIPPIVLCSFTKTSYSGLTISMISGSLIQPNMLEITLPENSLAGTYQINSTNTNAKNGVRYYSPAFSWTYSTYIAGSNVVINITSVSSNLVTGTFSGRLNRTSGSGYTIITNGTFRALLEK